MPLRTNESRWMPCALLVVVASLSVPAQAAEEGATKAVVYAGVPSSVESSVQAATLSRLDAPRQMTEPPVHLGELLGGEGLGTWNIQHAQGCTGEPVTPADYDAGLDELMMAYRMVEDTDTLARQLLSQWSCLTDPVARDALHSVSLYRGLGAAAEGRRDDARTAFSEVLVMAPTPGWDEGLEPGAAACVDDARRALPETPDTSLRVFVAPGAEVWVDGLVVGSPWEGVEVWGGTHLVQVRREPEGPLSGLTITTEGPGAGLVVDPVALEAGDPPDLGFRDRMADLFVALHDSGAGAPDLLVLLGEDPAVFRPDGSQAAARQQPNRSQVAGGVLMGAGAAVAITGTVLFATGRSRHGDWIEQYEDNPNTLWWDQNVAQEEANFDLMYVGGGLAIAGAVTAAVGIPLLVDGARRKRDGVSRPSAKVAISPGPTWFAISGEF